MRISTQMMHSSGLAGVTKGSNDLLRLQIQLGSGRRINSPADDPIGAAKAVTFVDAKALNDQIATNQRTAESKLRLAESRLGDAGDAIQDVREQLVRAGSAALSRNDRLAMASDLRQMKARLLDVANSRDSEGSYIFSGNREATQPFSVIAAGTVYQGDDGRQTLQVSQGRTMTVSENGAEIFQRARAGNGAFAVTPAGTNNGTAIVGAGSVYDQTLITNQNYAINFTVVGTTITYDVVNTTTAATIILGAAYTDGQSIRFEGIEIPFTGRPANGDVVTIAPSPNRSVFDTIESAILTIEQGHATPAQATRYQNSLRVAMSNLDMALDQTLGVRASMGASLVELDGTKEMTLSRDTQIRTDLSNVRDLDYAKAASDYLRTQQALEAAQRTYSQNARQSLFDFL